MLKSMYCLLFYKLRFISIPYYLIIQSFLNNWSFIKALSVSTIYEYCFQNNFPASSVTQCCISVLISVQKYTVVLHLFCCDLLYEITKIYALSRTSRKKQNLLFMVFFVTAGTICIQSNMFNVIIFIITSITLFDNFLSLHYYILCVFIYNIINNI